jgi:hypothetical protein
VLAEDRVRLDWTDSSVNEAGFKIEQKEEGGDYSNIAFAGADVKYRILYGRVPGTTYTYRVRAYNQGGNSSYSNEAVAALTKPNAPTQTMARAISASETVIAWQDNSVLEKRFILERKTGNCASADPWEAVRWPQANTEEYTDTGLQADTVYSYRIKASNSYGKSPYSECATSVPTGKEGTPGSPANLRAEAVDDFSIILGWNDNSTDEGSFKIFRRTMSDSTAWSLYSQTEAGITEFIDDSAAGNSSSTTYLYYVKACNKYGCSPPSAAAVVPHAPVALTAVPAAAGGISLAWEPAEDNPSGYIVYRKTGDCDSAEQWEELVILQEGSASHHDVSVTSGTRYSYLCTGFQLSEHHPVSYGYSLESSCTSSLAP